ncbi:MAG: hypothetical protein RXR10_07950 [Vulcanisaeta sp.]|jgi:hypothetical protein
MEDEKVIIELDPRTAKLLSRIMDAVGTEDLAETISFLVYDFIKSNTGEEKDVYHALWWFRKGIAQTGSEGRDAAEYLLKLRGFDTECRWLVTDEYYFDVYCPTGSFIVLGYEEYNVETDDVFTVHTNAKAAEEELSMKVVPFLYGDKLEPGVEEDARELGVWLVLLERVSGQWQYREVVRLEDALQVST